MNSISNTNNTKMSANAEPSQDNLTETLFLYIPRASLKTTDFIVKDAFFQNNIGDVDYCDLVVIKDKITKEPQHMSVFLKLASWNPFTSARSDFHTNGSIKLYLANEFWIILPNKTPLPRTHVNITQLAAATDTLFEQTDQIFEQTNAVNVEIGEMRKIINDQHDQIAILQANQATLIRMLEQVKHQMEALCNATTEPTPTRDFEMTLSELDPDEDQEQKEAEPVLPQPALMLPPPPPLTRNNAVLYDDAFEIEADEQYVAQAIQRTPSYCEDMYIPIPVQFDEDDCIFSKPLAPVSIPRLSRTVSVATEPVVLNPERPRSISPDAIVRASITRDICGNN
jgi:hypothetical protein